MDKYGCKKLRQRWMKENPGVTAAVELQPHFQGSVFVLTWIFERWSWRSKHTQPTNRVNTRIALPSLFTLLWLDFQRPRLLSLKGDAEKNNNTVSVSIKTNIYGSYHRADFCFPLLFFQNNFPFLCVCVGGACSKSISTPNIVICMYILFYLDFLQALCR